MSTCYIIRPALRLTGCLKVPADKSISHRVALMAALAEGKSQINNMLLGEDNLATLKALKNLGVLFEQNQHQVCIQGRGLYSFQQPHQPLDLANSGTALRLLAGILAAQSFNSVLLGDESLSRRPMQRIVEPLRLMGAQIEMSKDQTAPLFIKGNPHLQALHYTLPLASAQLKSCLLLAALYAEGESILFEPHSSRNHTELLLQNLGYPCQVEPGCISLSGRAQLKNFNYTVPGDISSAAFFIVAACLIPGSDIHFLDVGLNPSRRGVLAVLQKMGADLAFKVTHFEHGEPVGEIRVRYAPLHAIELGPESVAACIDEFPILFVAAACAKEGVSKFSGIEELRVKESDRIAVMLCALNALGIKSRSTDSTVEIEAGVLKGGVKLNCAEDHRVAMALSVAASLAREETVLWDCAKVASSYPGFVADAQRLGMRIKFS